MNLRKNRARFEFVLDGLPANAIGSGKLGWSVAQHVRPWVGVASMLAPSGPRLQQQPCTSLSPNWLAVYDES